MSQKAVVLLAGPTASGKSALAVRLARALGGVVVNADSMQVYRDLRILTARPSEADEAGVPHRLFGHVDGAVNHSVGRYVADVAQLLTEDGPPLVFVGGTGLYFKALTDGLSAVPAVPDDVRAAIRADAEGRTTGDLHATLARRDPAAAARLRPSDRMRITRTLEVWAATGRSLMSFQGDRTPGPLAGQALAKVFLSPDRDALRAAIDRRFEAMMAAGALDEVRALGKRRLDPALPVMRAHGVPGLLAHGRGEIGLDEAVARGRADTRAYAKRQVTWFRHQMPGWTAAEPERAYAVAFDLLDAALNRPG